MGKNSSRGLQWFVAFADHFVGSRSDLDELRRARTIAMLTTHTALIAFTFSALQVSSRPQHAAVLFGSGLALTANLLSLRWTKSLFIQSHFLTGVAVVTLTIAGFAKGGLESSALGWFPVVMVATAIYLRRLGRWGWALIMMGISMYGAMAADPVGWDPTLGSPMVFGASRALAVASAAITAGVFEASRARAYEALEARQKALNGRNREMRLVLDNVDQGLVTVDLRGVVDRERSAILDEWVGDVSPASSLRELIGQLDPQAVELVDLGLETIDAGVLPLKLALEQLPREIRKGEQHFVVDYRPIVDDSNNTERLLVMISDVTAQLDRREAEQRRRELVAVFERLIADRDGVIEFFKETGRIVRRIGNSPGPKPEALMRDVHSVKGNCLIFGLTRIATLCHEIEAEAAEHEGVASPAQRAELLSRWEALEQQLSGAWDATGDKLLRVYEEDLSRLIEAVQGETPRSVVATHLASLRHDSARVRLNRLAEEGVSLARRLKRGDVRVEVAHHDLRTPGTTDWSEFWTSLSHIVRNSIDHGVESSATRIEAGKNPWTTLRLETQIENDELVVRVEDDGCGIAWERVSARAEQMGLPSSTAAELQDALFADRLSTREVSTMVSGRGVGTSATKAACTALGGVVRVASEPGRFTRFDFAFPRSTWVGQLAAIPRAA